MFIAGGAKPDPDDRFLREKAVAPSKCRPYQTLRGAEILHSSHASIKTPPIDQLHTVKPKDSAVSHENYCDVIYSASYSENPSNTQENCVFQAV